jgi:hypothetical protein
MALDLLSDTIRNGYEVHEWRHALAILSVDFPKQWGDLLHALSSFRLFRSEVVRPGGGRSHISARLDAYFRGRDWHEQKFDTEFRVNGEVIDAKGHKVDNYFDRVACDVEWNNKTEFFDRDLNNFARLHQLGAVHVGIIITRASHLQREVFAPLGLTEAGKPYSEKYGASTTHMDKLVPKVNGGAAGGCPVVAFGIKTALFVDDAADPTLFISHPDNAIANRRSRRARR